MSNRPKTSNREAFDLLTALELEVDFDAASSANLTELLGEVSDWYSDPERARAAKVFALNSSPALDACKEVLARWLGRPLPRLEGEELVTYVADALLIAAEHSPEPEKAPRLLSFETRKGEVLLLRSESQRRVVGDEGWLPATLSSPDTEAALNGIFRIDGCTPAFSDHAPGCARCLAALKEWDTEHGLPDGWEHLRTWPPPSREPKAPLPPLPAVEGVGIVIRRNPEPERPPKPWWKFWGK